MDLGYADAAPLRIGEDNEACIAQAEPGIRHFRKARHCEVRLRFLQQLAVDKQAEFTYTPSEFQLADFLTNLLTVPSPSDSVMSSRPRLEFASTRRYDGS